MVQSVGYHRFLLPRVRGLASDGTGDPTHWHLCKISAEDAGDIMCGIGFLFPI